MNNKIDAWTVVDKEQMLGITDNLLGTVFEIGDSVGFVGAAHTG